MKALFDGLVRLYINPDLGDAEKMISKEGE